MSVRRIWWASCMVMPCLSVLDGSDSELYQWLQAYSEMADISDKRQMEPNIVTDVPSSGREETVPADARLRLREQLLEEVDAAWTRPRASRMAETDEVDESATRELARLRAIQVPRIEFLRTPLSVVAENLSLVSEQFDPEGVGINIVVVDPGGMDPEVHMTLRDLPLNRILDLVTESVGFEYTARPDVVVLRVSEERHRGLETEFFPLHRSTMIRLTGMRNEQAPDPVMMDPFAPEAGEQAQTGQQELEDALQNFFQRAGVPFHRVSGASLAFADGQLIVTHTPRNLEKVRNILRRYSEIRQVEIETRFIEVEAESLAELGLDWEIGTSGMPVFDARGMPVMGSTGRVVREHQNRFSNTPTRRITQSRGDPVEGNSRIIIDRPGATLPDLEYGPPRIPSQTGLNLAGGDLARMSGVIGSGEFKVLLRALERSSGSDLLSAPKVTVLSGKTAEITVAQEFRYPRNFGDIQADVGRGDSTSGSAGVAIAAGTPRDFAVRNLGVEMRVTPSVEENNAISLRLEPAVTEFDGFIEYGGPSVAIASDTTVTVPSGFYQPLFSIRRVRTEVTIWDGATVVMGGLTREENVAVEDRVPVLGNIPVVGRLFRTEGTRNRKRNLLIFVTANLVSPGGSAQQLGDRSQDGINYQLRITNDE